MHAGKHLGLHVHQKPQSLCSSQNVFTIKNVIKVAACIVSHMSVECVICDDHENYHYPSVGSFSFVLGVSFLFSVYKLAPAVLNIPQYIQYVYEISACIFLTNILLKLIWAQVIGFTVLVCINLSFYIKHIASLTELVSLNAVSDFIETESFVQLMTDIIGILLLIWVVASMRSKQTLKSCKRNPSCSALRLLKSTKQRLYTESPEGIVSKTAELPVEVDKQKNVPDYGRPKSFQNRRRHVLPTE